MRKPFIQAATILLLVFGFNNHSAAQSAQNFPDTATMDLSIKPGDNFYQYVNGNWVKNAVLSPIDIQIGSFIDVYNKTKDHLHTILEDAAKANAPKGSIEQKVGDFFEAAMDSATIEKRGYEPVKPILAQIDALKNTHDIMQFIAKQSTQGNMLLIGAYVGPDDKNSAMNIAVFAQAGLGLPNRNYYFKTDSATLGIVKAYQAYIQKMFVLTGDDPATATKKMQAEYALEKQLAASHRTNVELRDPQTNYNKMAVTGLDKTMPNFEWVKTLAALDIPTDSVNIQQPAYYKKVDSLLATTPLNVWKDYLHFQTLNNYARFLSTPFVNTRFDYIKKIFGQQKQRPRWERVSFYVNDNLGEALGQLYVEKYFTPEAKQKMLALVNNLQKAFEIRIRNTDWMSEATKQIAVEKLHAFIKKIGYPDKWRDYSKVVINRDKFFENIVSCAKNEYHFYSSKLGKRVDKTEWGMTPQTVNAYYRQAFNEIVFPAAILQAPMFDPAADDAVNYGAIGTIIGHEMTHGFDDDGAQYDKEGNLKNWWSHDDSVRFVAKTKRIIDQFNQFTVLDTIHVNGELTTGENIADLGGLNIAYDAFKMTKEGQDTLTKTNGYTNDQRFFISFAIVRRSKERESAIRQSILLDVHSPDIARTLGPLSNFTPFYKAFNVQPGDKMYKPENERIVIW